MLVEIVVVTTAQPSSPQIRGTIVVQGPIVAKEAPVGEAVVEIPVDVFREAVRALGQ